MAKQDRKLNDRWERKKRRDDEKWEVGIRKMSEAHKRMPRIIFIIEEPVDGLERVLGQHERVGAQGGIDLERDSGLQRRDRSVCCQSCLPFGRDDDIL